MESPEGVLCLDLEEIASDRQADGKYEIETVTPSRNSKSSFEFLDLTKSSQPPGSSSSCRSVLRLDRRSKRHRPERSDNAESSPSPIPDSTRSSTREIIPPADKDKHLPRVEKLPEDQKCEEKSPECCFESAVMEKLMAENKRLKEVLWRERRHHAKEKNCIRQVLFAIDEKLSSLPSRLGKIRVKNQRNLLRMNCLPIEFHDRGDFEIIVDPCPKYLEFSSSLTQEQDSQSEETNIMQRSSIQFCDDVYSDISNAQNPILVQKMESLNNLIEDMKKGHPGPIEAVLNNELCAISLLKNEIKYTKKKIEQKSKSDLESVIIADWQTEAQNPSKGTADTEDIPRLEKYVWLQKEAIRVLSQEVRKTKELFLSEMKEKEKVQSEKKALISEIAKLKNLPKLQEENQRWKGRLSDSNSAVRPFRLIKELKNQLEEKEKNLTNYKAKVSRLEAASSNKGALLESEKKKTEELEARLKIIATENKSFSVQINSLQYINKELKDQMNVLKNQIEILIKQNAELSTNTPYDLKKYFSELAEMMRKEDTRVRAVEEEAENRLKELEEQHLKNVHLIRTSFERSEKMNVEHMRTLKLLLILLHSCQVERNIKLKRKNSYSRAKDILDITESELDDLFGGNLRDTTEKELQQLHEKCSAFVNEDEDGEFSFKLSAWLFDVIKQKLIDQNSNDIPSD